MGDQRNAGGPEARISFGAGAFAYIALQRGETISAAWLLVAAVSTYLVAYRFYSKIIAAKVFALDATRPTPAERLEDGRDFVPTNKWIVFGHHFASISGPGPLVGPTLAAQFGFLPGAPLTRDQWKMLQSDNLPAANSKGLEAFGIKPTALAAVAATRDDQFIHPA